MESLSEQFEATMDTIIKDTEESKQPEEIKVEQDDKNSQENVEEPIRFFDWTEEMTQESQKILDEDDTVIGNSQKLENQAGKYWHVFYTRNTNNFFKDRHYLLKELTEMKEKCDTDESVLLLDAGCGVGNAMFPLCHLLPNLKVDAFDFAK